MKKFAEYIWRDGYSPTASLRSKTRVIEVGVNNDSVNLDNFPEWGFDGSSTQQAEGNDSDCILKPVSFVNDPIKGDGNYLVLCEVFNRDGSPHETNTRAVLRKLLQNGGAEQDMMLGYEKEYVLYENNRIVGWPEKGEPAAQGPYYCGVGAGKVEGRDLVDVHAQACLDADLLLYGTNAEVMLGQWEYQIGYRGFEEDADALKVTDHMLFAEWLLHRLAEDYNVVVNYENKPMKGDWNGSGCHVNFSTKLTRDKDRGKAEIERIIDLFGAKHDKHIALYGDKLDERLTGAHETCAITEFRAAESDRGASIRIPVATSRKGYGYLEDRRPGANSDAYIVAARLLATILESDESIFDHIYKRYTSTTFRYQKA